MAKHEIQTLISITGQGEEDVVAMLKKYGGDMDAATNALIDSESRARNVADPPIAGALSTAVICFALQGKPNGGDRLRCPPPARRPTRAPALTSPHPARPTPQWKSSRR